MGGYGSGLLAPFDYWESVGRHWLKHQRADGGWNYQGRGKPSTGSMSAAGLTSLFVTLDRYHAKRARRFAPLVDGIERGLDWFGREFAARHPHGDRCWQYYYLYGVERVGRASGYKYFRDRDWFRLGARHLLDEQETDGAWPATGAGMGRLRNTCFATLFLCHGRAPLMFNKLEHGGDWNERMRDLAGLTHWTSRTLERLLNWQIVSLAGEPADLLDASVLYIYGDGPREFSGDQVETLREVALRGGLLFGVAGSRSVEFVRSMQDLAGKAFPEYPVRRLDDGHFLFSGAVQFEIDDPPPTYEVHNGLRTLMLICGEDLAYTWNQQRGGRRDHFRLGCNVYNYAVDKTHARSRLTTNEIARQPVEETRPLRVALLEHAANWNPEPHGWARLAAYLHNTAYFDLRLSAGVSIAETDLADFEIAWLTGTEALSLSEPELDALRAFLRGGGTLIADAAGGSRAFGESFRRVMEKVLRTNPRRLVPDAPLIAGDKLYAGADLRAVRLTRGGRARVEGTVPVILTYSLGRRDAVLFSPLDLVGGLLGRPIWNRPGYVGDDTLRVVRNMLLYADLESGQKARLAEP